MLILAASEDHETGAPSTIALKPPEAAPSQPIAPAAPRQLSQRQQMVLSVPVIAKVKESRKEHGFVISTAGSNQKLEVGMTFAVRRGSGIIGRIKIDFVEEADAVGNIEIGSTPAGVAIESGDDVIQNLPPEA